MESNGLSPQGSVTAAAKRAPTFSVIMPTYNRAHLVMNAVNSVLEQTFTDFEFIIVDDGSTDGTHELLDAIEDPRVRVVSNTRTKGAPGARNTGIFMAAADWICAIDSDDLWDKDFLAHLATGVLQAHDEVGIVYGSTSWVDDGRVSRVKEASVGGFTFPRMLHDQFFYHTASAVRTSLLRELDGYDETLGDCEDTDVQLRLTQRCEMLPVPEAMYFYIRGGDDQMTRDYPRAAASMKRFMDKHFDLYDAHPAARFDTASKVLTLAVRGGQWKLARQMWLTIFPALWHEPVMFVRYQKRALFLLLARLRSKPTAASG